MKRTLFGFTAAALLAGSASADLISEFEPNPAGTDPTTVSVELSGDASTAFDLWILSIENDGVNGTVDRATNVTGSYDANGLAVVSIGDLENPSFTVILTDDFTGSVGDDLDAANSGTLDTSSLGTILDAIGVGDSSSDVTANYAPGLGGEVFATPTEWEIAFRDGTTGDWYGVDTALSEVYDIDGNLLDNSDFDISPLATTFGSVNPTLVPEPSSLALLGLGGLLIARRRRG